MKCEYCGFDLRNNFFLRKDNRTYYSPLWCKICRMNFPEAYKEAQNQKKRKEDPKSNAEATRGSREKTRRKNEENRRYWIEHKEIDNDAN